MADDDDKRAEEEKAQRREELFAELYRYLPAVKKYLRGCGFPPEQVEELAQDVFVRVYERMDQYRGGAPASYVKSVARTIALNELRRIHTVKRDHETVTLETVGDVTNRSAPSPENAVILNERSARLYEAVNQLSDNHRIIIMLCLAEASYEEMREILGISESAVKSRLRAAREKLRELLGGPDGLGDE